MKYAMLTFKKMHMDDYITLRKFIEMDDANHKETIWKQTGKNVGSKEREILGFDDYMNVMWYQYPQEDVEVEYFFNKETWEGAKNRPLTMWND